MTVIHEEFHNESRPLVDLANLSSQLSQLLTHERAIAQRGKQEAPEPPAPDFDQ